MKALDIAKQLLSNWNQELKNQEQAKIELAKYREQQYFFSFMVNMANDLYAGLQGGSYPHIKPVNNPRCIRPDSCKKVDGARIYYFRITKASLDTNVGGLGLDMLMRNMNTTIATNNRELFSLYGDNCANMYPFLYHGIYIMNIRDMNDGDLVLAVASNVQPEQLKTVIQY